MSNVYRCRLERPIFDVVSIARELDAAGALVLDHQPAAGFIDIRVHEATMPESLYAAIVVVRFYSEDGFAFSPASAVDGHRHCRSYPGTTTPSLVEPYAMFFTCECRFRTRELRELIEHLRAERDKATS